MNHRTDGSSADDMSAWERIKKAFANDWEQTKADFGVQGARDLDQDVDDTLKQAAGSDNAFENHEQAFRFGYTARGRFQAKHPRWNDDLDRQLRQEYAGNYDADRPYIQHAYGYEPKM